MKLTKQSGAVISMTLTAKSDWIHLQFSVIEEQGFPTDGVDGKDFHRTSGMLNSISLKIQGDWNYLLFFIQLYTRYRHHTTKSKHRKSQAGNKKYGRR